MTPAEYLQQHKIRDKLYALTRSLAIHQPHNPDVFLSASQRLVERDAVLDKSYVIELVTLPPEGQRVTAVRGRQIGATQSWLHESAKGVH